MLKCIVGNPANKFYAALGFVNQGEEQRPGRQPLNVWVLDVAGSGIINDESHIAGG